MKLSRTGVVAALLGAVVAFGASAWGQTRVPQVGKPAFQPGEFKAVVGTYGGRAVRDTLSEPKRLNPITAGETSTTDFTNRIFEGLTREDGFTGEMIPHLAESWSVADDKVTWTFVLREGLTFNDGAAVTAKDVAFTWNMLVYDRSRPAGVDPRWPCSLRDIAKVNGKEIEVTAVDERTVRVVTAEPIALLPRWMGGVVMPEHVYGKFVADGTFGSTMSTDSKPGEIVGSGPWMFKEYVRGDRVVLQRNPNYWRKDEAGNRYPYLSELVFRIVGSTDLMLLNFQQGITDTYGLSSGAQVPELRPKQVEGDFTLWQVGPTYGTEFLAFNMNREAGEKKKIEDHKVEWFRDARFRRAVTHAVDRASIVRNVYRTLGHPIGTPFTTAPGPYKHDGFVVPEFDQGKARGLLAEMGFKAGPGGTLVDEKGRELSFSLTTNAGNKVREQLTELIRKDLEAVGMKVNYLPLQFNLLTDKLDNSHDWEAMVMGFTGGLEPNDGANFWRSTARLHMWWPNQKTPGFEWEKRIDEVFDAGLRELDPVKRRAIYRGWIEIADREQPVVYLAIPERVVAIRNRFGNMAPSAGPTPIIHNEEQWFVLPGKDK
jgi:peptide/nickel transport system substrate-binding protein